MNVFPWNLFLGVFWCLVSPCIGDRHGLGIDWKWSSIQLDIVRHLENLAAVVGKKWALQLGKSVGDASVGEAEGGLK